MFCIQRKNERKINEIMFLFCTITYYIDFLKSILKFENEGWWHVCCTNLKRDILYSDFNIPRLHTLDLCHLDNRILVWITLSNLSVENGSSVHHTPISIIIDKLFDVIQFKYNKIRLIRFFLTLSLTCIITDALSYLFWHSF